MRRKRPTGEYLEPDLLTSLSDRAGLTELERAAVESYNVTLSVPRTAERLGMTRYQAEKQLEQAREKMQAVIAAARESGGASVEELMQPQNAEPSTPLFSRNGWNGEIERVHLHPKKLA